MKRKILLSSCLVAISLFGAGCAISHPAKPPQLTFANYTPIILNVQTPTVLETFKSKTDTADVSGQFVMSPSEAFKTYAASRFKGGGAMGGEFTLDIQESFVHITQIEQDSKVLRATGFGKEDQYRVYMQVNVAVQPSGFNGRQSTTIKMDRTLVMPSSVTLQERDMRQTRFLEKLIHDLDKRVNEAIDQTPAIRG